MERECLDKKHHLIRGSNCFLNSAMISNHPPPTSSLMQLTFFFSCFIRARIYDLGPGGEESSGETPVIKAAAERPVLPPEAPAHEETREGGSLKSSVWFECA